MNKYQLIPVREPTTDQSTDITRIQLGEPMDFAMVIYNNMGEGLLTGTENDSYTTKTHLTIGDGFGNPTMGDFRNLGCTT